jgi:NAD(P)-dependent dehydrogenase (short-subunit alcohol dehydrogenase family)
MAMYVATQYGKQGIRCNAINPGLIRTEGGKKNVHGPILDIVTRNHLTPYVGQPEDIAAMAAYLCSEDGRFITGQAINVDGGINAHMPYYAEMQNLNVKWDIPLTPGAESAA